MATKNNLAYPYAKASFEFADGIKAQDIWQESLKTLGLIVQDYGFINLMNNPRVSKEQLLDILFGALKDSEGNGINNFLLLLAKNNRLQILPQIYVLFEKFYDAKKNQTQAIIQSAFAISADDKSRLEALLSKKMDKQITAEVEICPQLIGGIKIIINDMVIDGSVMGSLNKMATKLIQ